MDIKILKNTDYEFYKLLGPFLARRSIEKEIGSKIYDDDNKIWFVAKKDKDVIGFAAVIKNNVCSSYILPQYRKIGIFTKILLYIINNYKKLKTVANQNSYKIFLKNGFIVKRKKGSFYVMERE